VLHVPLPRIFCLNTRKGFPSNAQFLLLTLKLPSVRAERYFVAHMFTSCHCVADVVPADRREGEHCQAPSPIRHHALSHKALVKILCGIQHRARSHAHLPAGAFGGDELTRCGGDFGCETLDRRRVVCGKDESGYAVFERDSRQLFSPLLRRSVE